jgi:hypothetical protein
MRYASRVQHVPNPCQPNASVRKCYMYVMQSYKIQIMLSNTESVLS